jgi:transposase
VLDDFSRFIVAWKLCATMKAQDVTATLDLALAASGLDQINVVHRPRLQSWRGFLRQGAKVGPSREGRSLMKTRRRFTAEFKAKVALEAIQGHRTVAELAKRHELHPNLIAQWKRQAIEKLARVFDDKALEPSANRDAEVTKLHAKIGQLVVERDFLAKAFDR